MNPQKLIMDLQISNSCDFYPGTPFPQFMTIEYFRYYKLKLDCGTVATVLSNTTEPKLRTNFKKLSVNELGGKVKAALHEIGPQVKPQLIDNNVR